MIHKVFCYLYGYSFLLTIISWYLNIQLSIYLYIRQTFQYAVTHLNDEKCGICLSVCPFGYLYVITSVCPSVCPYDCSFLCLSVCLLSVYLSVPKSVCPFIHTFICPSACPSLCSSVNPSFCPLVCLSVCP